MNAEQRYEMLISYAEGTLRADQRQDVEVLLSRYPELQNDLEMITLAFDSLHVERQPEVPAHYFSNFTAVFRQRIATREQRTVRSIPGILRSFLRPAAAFAVTASILFLFRMLEPQSLETGIHSLVKDVEQSEIISAGDESSVIAAETAETVLEERFPDASFGVDPSVYLSESEMFAFFDDHETDQVIAQLQQQYVDEENL